MTEAFSQQYYRAGFGPALPVSNSLRAAADRPFSTLLTDWKNHVSLDDPRSLSECTFHQQSHAIPTAAELHSHLANIDGELNAAFYASSTYRDIQDIWLFWNEDEDSPNIPSHRLDVNELIALALYFDHALGKDLGYDAALILPYFILPEFTNLPWVDELSPLILSMKTDPLTADYIDYSKHPATTSMTIGEVLHTVSRFPDVFAVEPEAPFHEVLALGEDELRAVAGEAWVSYAMLTCWAFSGRQDPFEDIVDVALDFAASKIPVEALQPYVTRLGPRPELIIQAIDNGVGADMLPMIPVVEGA